MLDLDKITEFLKIAKEFGIIPRIKNVEIFAEENRVLLLKHKESAIDIDISLGILPFEIEAIQNSTLVKFGKVSMKIPSVEDFIILKAVAHRGKDILDIKEITKIHPNLNTARIKKNVKEFAKVLEMPELWDDIEKILKDAKKHGK
jgi:predicted nucleotidyltransferase